MSGQDFPITITARHMDMTDAMRDHVETRVRRLHLEYPKIIEAKAVLDAQSHGHIAEIVLFCTNHVTLEASTETQDLYEAIDKTAAKIERQMRKEKTRLLKEKGH